MGPAAFAICVMLSLAGIAHPTAPRWARLVFAFLIASSAIGLVAAFTSGCAGQVVDTASTCPDHAIPTTTCDVPLPTYCVYEPNVQATSAGLCIVDIMASCTPELRYHLVYAMDETDAGWAATVNLWGSQCRLEAR